MFAFLKSIGKGIASFFGMILVPFKKVAPGGRLHPVVRWLLHALTLLLVLGLLTLANYQFDLGRVLRAPTPWVRIFWLPLLFLLFYLLCWSGWWIWKMLSQQEEEVSQYPDIDRAWEEAEISLNDAGIDLSTVPIFLVIGKPRGSEEALFSSADIDWTVNQVPRRPDSPIYVYGSPEAIFVTCADNSLLGRQASLLEETERRLRSKRAMEAVPISAEEATDMDQRSQRSSSGRSSDSTTASASTSSMAAARLRAGRTPRLLNMTEEVELLTARLRHTLRVIQRARDPFCPLNGILLLIPFAAIDSDESAQQTGAIIRRDLSSVRSVLQIHCPLFALLCDLETAPGFADFISSIPTELRQRPMGRDFPLLPDIEREAIPRMINSGVEWLCQDLMRTAVYKLFRVEGSGREDPMRIMLHNTRLFVLMYALVERQARLSRVLTRATASESRGPILFGGIYLAGTGRDPHERAFIPGVFRLLVENQNYVSWTAEANDLEKTLNRYTRMGYIGMTVLIAIMIIICTSYWQRLY
ncbi:hypothetical protein Pan216_32960 [Planctomycetes bacterium Pan216]|uniref:Type VI secretion system component TssM1 N-terminal domain-containing protein n=1 Tax=Kolteria novifilia TaxID=2527975 RepID=A0A518B623_9BACT|nr:hypothetical protein Pan216_32960 [Planctomycetes bacterium Pan216]